MLAPSPTLAVVGSANVDYVVRVAELPPPGATVLSGDVVRLCGGKGANQAVAAARLGAQVAMYAAVGDDADGAMVRRNLETFGVDTSFVTSEARPTGSAFITVDDRGENTIVVAPGANAALRLPETADVLTRADVVLAQLEVPLETVSAAASRARRFVLNVAPYREVPAELVARCALIIANEGEYEGIREHAIGDVVVTLGARGAAYLRGNQLVAKCEAPRVNVIDAVGAGDVFCAAAALQLARGATEEALLQYAVTAASLSTTALGAQGALPTHQEVLTWLERA